MERGGDRRKSGGFFSSFFRLSKRSSRSRGELGKESGDVTAVAGEEEAGSSGRPLRGSRTGLRKSRSQTLVPQGGGAGRKGAAGREPEWVPFSRPNRILCRSSDDILSDKSLSSPVAIPTEGDNAEDGLITSDEINLVDNGDLPPRVRRSGRSGRRVDPTQRHSVIGILDPPTNKTIVHLSTCLSHDDLLTTSDPSADLSQTPASKLQTQALSYSAKIELSSAKCTEHSVVKPAGNSKIGQLTVLVDTAGNSSQEGVEEVNTTIVTPPGEEQNLNHSDVLITTDINRRNKAGTGTGIVMVTPGLTHKCANNPGEITCDYHTGNNQQVNTGDARCDTRDMPTIPAIVSPEGSVTMATIVSSAEGPADILTSNNNHVHVHHVGGVRSVSNTTQPNSAQSRNTSGGIGMKRAASKEGNINHITRGNQGCKTDINSNCSSKGGDITDTSRVCSKADINFVRQNGERQGGMYEKNKLTVKSGQRMAGTSGGLGMRRVFGSRGDITSSKSDISASVSDVRASVSDVRTSRSDVRASRADIRASRTDLRSSRLDLTRARDDLSEVTGQGPDTVTSKRVSVSPTVIVTSTHEVRCDNKDGAEERGKADTAARGDLTRNPGSPRKQPPPVTEREALHDRRSASARRCDITNMTAANSESTVSMATSPVTDATPVNSPVRPVSSPVIPVSFPVSLATSPVNPVVSPVSLATSPVNPVISPVRPVTSPQGLVTVSPTGVKSSSSRPAVIRRSDAGVKGQTGDNTERCAKSEAASYMYQSEARCDNTHLKDVTHQRQTAGDRFSSPGNLTGESQGSPGNLTGPSLTGHSPRPSSYVHVLTHPGDVLNNNTPSQDNIPGRSVDVKDRGGKETDFRDINITSPPLLRGCLSHDGLDLLDGRGVTPQVRGCVSPATLSSLSPVSTERTDLEDTMPSAAGVRGQPFRRQVYSQGSHDSGFYQGVPRPMVVNGYTGSHSNLLEGNKQPYSGATERITPQGRADRLSAGHMTSNMTSHVATRVMSRSFGSLLSCSSSETDDDDYYDRPVVRKSRSYHDLRRSRAKAKTGPQSKARSHDNMLDQFDSDASTDDMGSRSQLAFGSGGHPVPVRHRRGRKVVNLTSENESLSLMHRDLPPNPLLKVRDYPVAKATENKRDVRRAESADNLSRRRRKQRVADNPAKSTADLNARSQSLGHGINVKDKNNVKVNACTSGSKVNRPQEVTAHGDIGKMAIKHQMSMAASAAYIPGVSLSDKLRLAASKGQVDKVRELLGAGATFEPDREGRTAVHYAALNGYADIVKFLSDDGCDIDAQDKLGYTALHRSAAQGHLEVIKVLLTEACQIDKQDEVHGNSALHEAAWNGYSKTLELLVQHKANVMVVNKAGFSALHLAAQNGHNQSGRVLLYAGCNSSHKNNYGDTAMHTAARYGHAGVTRILISARAKLTDTNKNGDTALHIAAALKRRKIAKLLVDSGIAVGMKNKQNETAADVGRRKDHTDIVTIISAQSKDARKKSKKLGGKSKKSQSGMTIGTMATEDDEKKEKKSFFFGKKKKKAAEKEVVVMETAAVPQQPMPVPMPAFPSAPSEMSSSDFNSLMTPEDVVRGFRPRMRREARSAQRESSSEARSQARGTSTGSRSLGRHEGRGKKEEVVKGMLSKYAPQQGMQYYKDLAGNVKQGPIGYAPVCNCGPTLKKIEKQLEADKGNMYDHIDASHRTLADKIEVVDKRAAQSGNFVGSTVAVHGGEATESAFQLDRMTTDRFEKEKTDRDEYVRRFLEAEQAELDRRMKSRHNHLQFDLQSWVDDRLSTFEQRYTDETPAQDPQPQLRYHRDDMMTSHPLLRDDAPPPGKLWKSRSDETLSVSSSHPSRSRSRHKMSRARAQKESSDLKLSTYADRAHRLERKIRAYNAKREKDTTPARGKSRDQLVVEERWSRDALHQVDYGRTPRDFESGHVRQRPLTYHEGQGQLGQGQLGVRDAPPPLPQQDYSREGYTRDNYNSYATNSREHTTSADYNSYNGYREQSLPRNFRGQTERRREVNGFHPQQQQQQQQQQHQQHQQPPAPGHPHQYRSSSLEPQGVRDPPLRVRNGSVESPPRPHTHKPNPGAQVQPKQQQQQHQQYHNQQPGYNNQQSVYNKPQQPVYSKQQPPQPPPRGYYPEGQQYQYKPATTNNNYMSQPPASPTRGQQQRPVSPARGQQQAVRGVSGSKSMEFPVTPRSAAEGAYIPHSNTFDSTPSPGGPHQSTPAPPSTPYTRSQGGPTPPYPSPQSPPPYPSPQSASSPETFQVEAQIHHSKTDSGSNPDSGYSSRIYRMHGALSNTKLTNSQLTNNSSTLSSFQSSPTNSNNTAASPGNNHHHLSNATDSMVTDQSSPMTTNSEEGYNRRGGPAPFNPVSDVLNAWYQQKLYETGTGKGKVKPDNRNVYNAHHQGAPLVPPRTYGGSSAISPPAPASHRMEIGRATQV